MSSRATACRWRPTQTLAANADATDFQDVRAFLESGGQKGPQRKILREGAYAINLAQFVVADQGARNFALDAGRATTHAVRRRCPR